MNKIFPIILAGISAIFVAVGALFLKKASDNLSGWFGLIGLAIYGCSFVLTLIALRYANLTAIVAVGALSYILVFCLSIKYLGEEFTWFKLIGSIIIIAGIILVNYNV